MKKRFISILLVCFTLWGCGQSNDIKGEFDLKGKIIEISKDAKSILMDDEEVGLVWVTINDPNVTANYKVGQQIVVWIDGGLKESYPAQGMALNIQIIDVDK